MSATWSTWSAKRIVIEDGGDAFVLTPWRPGSDGTRVIVNPWLDPDFAAVVDGEIHTGSLSTLLEQYERERRRIQAHSTFLAWFAMRDAIADFRRQRFSIPNL